MRCGREADYRTNQLRVKHYQCVNPTCSVRLNGMLPVISINYPRHESEQLGMGKNFIEYKA